MATSWLKSLHVNKGKSIARTISDRTDYVNNPDKTRRGQLVIGYECDPRTVDAEFLLSKKEYEYITARDQGRHNVLAYHLRQSFRPGEITPEEANEIGRELVLRFTKGNHAFIVATHTDRAHFHNHIIFNSTTLDCTKKFVDPKRSGMIVRRLSDLICLEHGLSVIENPKRSKGRNYGKWLGDNKPVPWSEQIRQKIDETLPSCATFESFLTKLRECGYIVNDNRKHISVCALGQKRAWRLNTLGGDYTEAAIHQRIAGVRIVGSGGDSGVQTRVNLLIDIQAKISEGKGAGYAQWAKIFNLKQAAKTLLFLQDNGIDSYEDLKKKSASASGDFTALTRNIRETEARMREISELQKYIGQYSKTRAVYDGYKASKWNRGFYDEHTGDIILHRAAKKYFDDLGMKKLPSMKALKQEWATLDTEKKKLYGGYHKAKENSHALTIAKHNADRILGITQDAEAREVRSAKQHEYSHEL